MKWQVMIIGVRETINVFKYLILTSLSCKNQTNQSQIISIASGFERPQRSVQAFIC